MWGESLTGLRGDEQAMWWIHKTTHVKINRISSDNSLTALEESSVAGSKLVSALVVLRSGSLA